MTAWPTADASHVATWSIAALATAGVLLRPRGWPEAVFAVGGAVLLVLARLLPPASVLSAVGGSLDVVFFLTGLMLLAELARSEGLFDTLSAWAVRRAGGSGPRLFALVYGIGVVVTAFMSNDATAVVLTPAVHAAARRAGARPLPYLFACALVANAASFVLPIANPANLVVFGSHLPPLGAWWHRFAPASIAAVVITWAVLRWRFRAELGAAIAQVSHVPGLSQNGLIALLGVAGVVLAMLVASALGASLGLPTLLACLVAIAAVHWNRRRAPWALLRHVDWGVLALVAGLFVLVAGLEHTGLIGSFAQALHQHAEKAPHATAWVAGAGVALVSNLVNNLPAGLIAGTAANAGALPDIVRSAIAVGIDLGPNLSVTGSLATLLWLAALRREGEHVSAWQFLAVGALAMPAALVAALACVF
ncbi:MAG TPA: SLC13 family permease, partial [Burkholderiaceae bacterium]